MDFGAPVRRSIFRNPGGRNRAVDIFTDRPPLSGDDLRHSHGTHGLRVGHAGPRSQSPIPRPITLRSTPMIERMERRKQSCNPVLSPQEAISCDIGATFGASQSRILLSAVLESISPRGPLAVQKDVSISFPGGTGRSLAGVPSLPTSTIGSLPYHYRQGAPRRTCSCCSR